jgi:hypothetical protein
LNLRQIKTAFRQVVYGFDGNNTNFAAAASLKSITISVNTTFKPQAVLSMTSKPQKTLPKVIFFAASRTRTGHKMML